MVYNGWKEKEDIVDQMEMYIRMYRQCTFSDIFTLYMARKTLIDGDHALKSPSGDIVWTELSEDVVKNFTDLFARGIKVIPWDPSVYYITCTQPMDRQNWVPSILTF